MQDDLFTFYQFNRWANDQIVQAIRQLTPEQYIQEPVPGWPPVRFTLVHLADATDIWARRVQGGTVTARTTEAELPALDDAVRLLEKTQAAFERLLPTLTPEQLAADFSYRNLKGETQALPLWAVLRHVVNHAGYHRGQIASKLDFLGIEPPLTDFALWAISPTL